MFMYGNIIMKSPCNLLLQHPSNWAWWFTPINPVLERQKDHEFEASLDCIARLFLKKQQKEAQHLNSTISHHVGESSLGAT
jgi:hypothetical protein